MQATGDAGGHDFRGNYLPAPFIKAHNDNGASENTGTIIKKVTIPPLATNDSTFSNIIVLKAAKNKKTIGEMVTTKYRKIFLPLVAIWLLGK
jgi:hypothetical protein